MTCNANDFQDQKSVPQVLVECRSNNSHFLTPFSAFFPTLPKVTIEDVVFDRPILW